LRSVSVALIDATLPYRAISGVTVTTVPSPAIAYGLPLSNRSVTVGVTVARRFIPAGRYLA
jgi:hypothetical protein